MEERKGFLTPNQEKGIDELIELDGVAEAMAGIAIKIADNQVLERMKAKIPTEVLPAVYEVIDEILAAFGVSK